MSTLSLLFAMTALADPVALPVTPPSLSEDILRAAPQNAVMAISIQDMDGLRSRSSENAWGKFFADPAMGELCAYLEKEGVSWSAMMEQSELPFDPLELLASIHDSVNFFVVPVGDAMEPGFGLLIAPGEERGAFEDHYDQILELMGAEMAASSESYGDVALTLYENAYEHAGDDPDIISFESGGLFTDIFSFESGGLFTDIITFESGGLFGFVGSTDRDSSLLLAHGVLDRFSGSDDSAGLSQSQSLADARSSAGGHKSIEFLLDLSALLKLIGEHEDDPDFEQAQHIMGLIGLTEVRYVYMNADIGSGESFDMNFLMHVPEGSYIETYLDFFGPQPKDLAGLLPSEATSVMLVNYDLFGAWGATLEIMQEHAPEIFEQVQGGLEMATATKGLDIEQDLLAQISGSAASFTMVVPEEEMDAALGGLTAMGLEVKGFDQGNATIVGLEDPDIVELFLEDVLDMAGVYGMIQQDEFQGELVNSITVPGAMSLHWSFIEAGLVLSEYPSALRSTLRLIGQEDAQTALGSEPFKSRVRGHAESSMLGVNDTAETVRTTLAAGSLMAQMFSGMIPDFPDLSDMPLPGPELGRKYFKGTLLSTLDRTKTSLVLSTNGR